MLANGNKTTLVNDLVSKRDQIIIGNKTVLQYMNESNTKRIVNYYNAKNDAQTKIWKSDVSRDEIIKAINMSEFASLTAAKRDSAGVFLLCTVFDLTVARVRTNVTDIFGAASDTETKIFAKCDRVATNLELLFTTNSVSSIYGYLIDDQEMVEIFSLAKAIIKTL